MTDGIFTWNCLRWGKYLADGTIPHPGDDVLNHGFACYNLYETHDGRIMALGALEPQFWSAFCEAVSIQNGTGPTMLNRDPIRRRCKKILQLFSNKKPRLNG